MTLTPGNRLSSSDEDVIDTSDELMDIPPDNNEYILSDHQEPVAGPFQQQDMRGHSASRDASHSRRSMDPPNPGLLRAEKIIKEVENTQAKAITTPGKQPDTLNLLSLGGEGWSPGTGRIAYCIDG